MLRAFPYSPNRSTNTDHTPQEGLRHLGWEDCSVSKEPVQLCGPEFPSPEPMGRRILISSLAHFPGIYSDTQHMGWEERPMPTLALSHLHVCPCMCLCTRTRTQKKERRRERLRNCQSQEEPKETAEV